MLIGKKYIPICEYLKEENFTDFIHKRVDDLPELAEMLTSARKSYEYFLPIANEISSFGYLGLIQEVSLTQEQTEVIDKVINLQGMLTQLLVRTNQLQGLPFDKDIPWQWCVHPLFHNVFNDGVRYEKNKPKTPGKGEVLNYKARLAFWMFAQDRWKHDASINKKMMIDKAIEELELYKSAHTLRRWLLQAEEIHAIDVPDQHTQPGRPSKN